jgi:hypothetical protein
MSKGFSFSAQEIHRLDHFSPHKELCIQVGDYSFKYSFEQLAFLSPLAFSHFQTTTEPFLIVQV